MIVSVKVRPGTREPAEEGGVLIVHTAEKFERGLANRDVVKQVAAYYGVSTGDVVIRSGHTSRRKIIEIRGK